MSDPKTPPGPLLTVEDLHTEYRVESRVVRAVTEVSFAVARGEIVGLVGESGSGKSATGLSILRLLPPEGRIVRGRVLLDGTDLTKLPDAEMRRVRGGRVAMIFQDPMTSLNPYLRIEEQLAEVGVLHLGLSQKDAIDQAVALLDRVGIPDARRRARGYPHEMSGGMRQRAMIAMALLGKPELLIADEPTTALDVTIQAQILELLRELVQERGLSVILVTHDLGVIAEVADRVLVMYAGRIVETGSARDVLARPEHPYTTALLRSVPQLDQRAGRLESIQGMPPRLDQGLFTECTFAPRCRLVRDACRTAEPPLAPAVAGSPRLRRCILSPDEVAK
ncbi:MAG TPA: ABC transporter ATP-binding protein [Polyangiaceae bacterium]|jgi:oligopeptide/dipeptide ABC transporter ATP-binding protein|nr:ABC transporter ATP-binding protein [Polyangiaceae bacterium]